MSKPKGEKSTDSFVKDTLKSEIAELELQIKSIKDELNAYLILEALKNATGKNLSADESQNLSALQEKARTVVPQLESQIQQLKKDDSLGSDWEVVERKKGGFFSRKQDPPKQKRDTQTSQSEQDFKVPRGSENKPQ